jgi:hypothetical protein
MNKWQTDGLTIFPFRICVNCGVIMGSDAVGVIGSPPGSRAQAFIDPVTENCAREKHTEYMSDRKNATTDQHPQTINRR